MKFICSLSILMYFVSCGAALDVTEYCEEQCKDVCVPCQEPTRCTEDQNDCGLGTPDPAFGGVCPAHSICVQKDYNCPCLNEKGEAYPLTTKVDCGEDQLVCSGASPGNSCPGQDVCVARGIDKNGNLCAGFCPVECKENELHCQVPSNPVTGCAELPMCVPKSIDSNGGFCPTQQCPLLCLEIDFFCEGAIIELGCKDPDTCIPKGTSYSGELCAGKCPVKCDPIAEIKCNGQVDTTGCTGPDTCHAKARNVNGEFCPDNSDSHGCSIICPEDEVLCPAKMNILGCKEQAICSPKTKDKNDNDCPETSVCPTICQPNEVSCPGGIDENGCKKPDVCIRQERDYDGDLCPAHCPGICGDTEILCEGHRDEMGCEAPDTCSIRGTKKEGNDIGDLCPGHCPANCKHHEVKCPSYIDCDGCSTEEICRPKAKDNNGGYCADDSASHNCPVECDERIGQVLCQTYEAPLGCKPKAMCKSRPLVPGGAKDEFCPSHSVCLKECQWDEVLCSDGIDSRGCKNEDLCLERGTDKDGNLCPDICPPKCTSEEFFCAGTTQNNGCKGLALCVEKKTDNNGIVCPAVCPVFCTERELKVHGETDARGCLMEDTCKVNDCYDFDADYMGNELNNCGMKTDSAQECQVACENDDGCVEFTWIGIPVDDDENNKGKCCLKSTYYDNKNSAAGLVSGPKHCGNSAFVMMPTGTSCATGTEIASESRCQEASGWASSLGLKPKRPLQVGNWPSVPHQCSAQVGLDDAVHFSTNSETDNARFTTGEFVMICESVPATTPDETAPAETPVETAPSM